MFSFLFKQYLSMPDFFPDRMDRHNHLLWGVDDGSHSLKESRAIIRELRSLGFRGAWCTPHMKEDTPNNTSDTLRRRFDQLIEEVKDEDFELRLAAEYMLDGSFEKNLEQGDLLTWDGTHVLTEIHQICPHGSWRDMLSELQDKGYTPVLAHPERYGHILTEEDIFSLAEQGILFQGNITSLVGFYGSQIKKRTQFFRQHKLYSWWGTDAHQSDVIAKLSLRMKIEKTDQQLTAKS